MLFLDASRNTREVRFCKSYDTQTKVSGLKLKVAYTNVHGQAMCMDRCQNVTHRTVHVACFLIMNLMQLTSCYERMFMILSNRL